MTQVSFFGDTGVNLMQNAFDSPLTKMSKKHDTDVSTEREVLSCRKLGTLYSDRSQQQSLVSNVKTSQKSFKRQLIISMNMRNEEFCCSKKGHYMPFVT